MEYFTDGLTEDIIGALARVPGVLVAARTSVFSLKGLRSDIREIGARLGVGFVVEGSVRRAEGRVRVNAQVVEASSGFQKWAEAFDMAVVDSAGIPERVAEAIAQSLPSARRAAERPVRRTPTYSIDAYEFYLKARYHWTLRTEAGFRQSIEFYDQARSADPSFAPAYCGLADCYVLLAIYGHLPPAIFIPKAKVLALQAIELNAESPEAFTTLGMIAAFYDWDHEAAKEAFQHAIRIQAGYPDAHQWYASAHLCTLGRFLEAIDEFEIALRADPLSLTLLGDLGNTLSLAGRHLDGLEACGQAVSRDPRFFRTYWQLGLIYERMGRPEEAIRSFEQCQMLSAGNPFESNAVACLGHAFAIAGRTKQARDCLKTLEELAQRRLANPLSFAIVHTGLRDSDKAFEWLNRAADARIGPALWTAIDPRCVVLREDPRFLQLMVRFGLVD
jgi:serine/threonine-protein kinase